MVAAILIRLRFLDVCLVPPHYHRIGATEDDRENTLCRATRLCVYLHSPNTTAVDIMVFFMHSGDNQNLIPFPPS